MSSQIKISFVIPAYNEECLLGSCIEAIQKETGRVSALTEIIVVNNASTDHTKEVAAQYKGVTTVDEPRKGLTQARQSGFLHAQGELIANIDADTRLSQGWIEKVLREFESHPDLVALSGPCIHYDVPWITRFLVTLFYGGAFLFYLFNRYILGTGSMLQGGNFVIRRHALETIGGYNTSIAFYGEDTDMARRLHTLGAVKFTPRLYVYSSGRRLLQEGIFTIGWRYALNYLWETFLKKPFTNTYKDIRAHAPDRSRR